MLSALPRWDASARSRLAACSESRIGFTIATASCKQRRQNMLQNVEHASKCENELTGPGT
jgi:hypothetical protein